MQVLHFDSTGKLIRKVGRSGSGPGDFASVTWLGQCASNSVFVNDFVRKRITVLDDEGGIVRTYAPGSAGSFIGCRKDGTAAFWRAEPFVRVPTADDPPLKGEVWLGNAEWKLEKSLGTFEWGVVRSFAAIHRGRTGVRMSSTSGRGEPGEVGACTPDGRKLRTIATEAASGPASLRFPSN
ncbi:MAG: hypothetical protein ACT443_00690 [Gemmatimonadota bacterium]